MVDPRSRSGSNKIKRALYKDTDTSGAGSQAAAAAEVGSQAPGVDSRVFTIVGVPTLILHLMYGIEYEICMR